MKANQTLDSPPICIARTNLAFGFPNFSSHALQAAYHSRGGLCTRALDAATRSTKDSQSWIIRKFGIRARPETNKSRRIPLS
ncbi:hypothetical protein LMH87_002227 [Akanthomyces muscarius]|uniref:Uncharacterized protein n=1 Tax=Akanthomyces muscarius TaxID=2231603 RepID=A0A9W8Q6E5_AKAMU|nr:hypothetical protein LMH87_002227 [Akanthomyces muscarius]KAJ4147719.1 hypothetical protein LMH87_002227 [Akanthomyces muscarius]